MNSPDLNELLAICITAGSRLEAAISDKTLPIHVRVAILDAQVGLLKLEVAARNERLKAIQDS